MAAVGCFEELYDGEQLLRLRSRCPRWSPSRYQPLEGHRTRFLSGARYDEGRRGRLERREVHRGVLLSTKVRPTKDEEEAQVRSGQTRDTPYRGNSLAKGNNSNGRDDSRRIRMHGGRDILQLRIGRVGFGNLRRSVTSLLNESETIIDRYDETPCLRTSISLS